MLTEPWGLEQLRQRAFLLFNSFKRKTRGSDIAQRRPGGLNQFSFHGQRECFQGVLNLLCSFEGSGSWDPSVDTGVQLIHH